MTGDMDMMPDGGGAPSKKWTSKKSPKEYAHRKAAADAATDAAMQGMDADYLDEVIGRLKGVRRAMTTVPFSDMAGNLADWLGITDKGKGGLRAGDLLDKLGIDPASWEGSETETARGKKAAEEGLMAGDAARAVMEAAVLMRGMPKPNGTLGISATGGAPVAAGTTAAAGAGEGAAAGGAANMLGNLWKNLPGGKLTKAILGGLLLTEGSKQVMKSGIGAFEQGKELKERLTAGRDEAPDFDDSLLDEGFKKYYAQAEAKARKLGIVKAEERKAYIAKEIDRQQTADMVQREESAQERKLASEQLRKMMLEKAESNRAWSRGQMDILNQSIRNYEEGKQRSLAFQMQEIGKIVGD